MCVESMKRKERSKGTKARARRRQRKVVVVRRNDATTRARLMIYIESYLHLNVFIFNSGTCNNLLFSLTAASFRFLVIAIPLPKKGERSLCYISTCPFLLSRVNFIYSFLRTRLIYVPSWMANFSRW